MTYQTALGPLSSGSCTVERQPKLPAPSSGWAAETERWGVLRAQ